MHISQAMVFLAILILSSFQTQAQHKKKIHYYELDVIRGLFFQPNTIAPYTGMAVEEFADGRKKMQVPIKDGKINGVVREWAVNGQKIFEAEYAMGVQTGTETQWYANGQKSLEIPYTNGSPDGLCLEWYKHGRKKSEGLFVNGKEEGEHRWWFYNGQLDQELTYKNGKAEGLVKNWYESGQLKMESEFRNGLREGRLTRWHANGQKHSEGFYKGGKADGEENTWSKSGLLEGKKIFKAGELVQEFNYRSGNIFLGTGYLQVFNERESFFTIEVRGAAVSPRWTSGLSSYSVDGALLQLFNYPISNFAEESLAEHTETELLQLFQKSEGVILQEKYQAELEVESAIQQTSSGKNYLYWSFPVPASFSQREGAKKVREEHYLSVICNRQVLNLRSVVMEGQEAEEIREMLQRTAETLKIASERIDLNTILDQPAGEN